MRTMMKKVSLSIAFEFAKVEVCLESYQTFMVERFCYMSGNDFSKTLMGKILLNMPANIMFTLYWIDVITI